jgi:hypothetical protein
MSGTNNGWDFEITPATPDEMALTDSFTNMSDPATFGGHSGWFDNWNWDKVGKAAKEVKSDVSDITKLGESQQQKQQALQAAGGQATRGEGFTSIEELLQQLQARRQALATLGLQPGPFQPRAPGGGLLGLVRGG